LLAHSFLLGKIKNKKNGKKKMSSPETLEEQPTTQPLTLSLLKVYKKLKEIKNFAALVLNKKKKLAQ
jgi:hypothetical protein